MATLAQDESRKTSARVKCGQQTSMEKGVVYGNGNVLGYDRVGRELVVNTEQADTVRKIFKWYAEGRGLRWIMWELEKRGIDSLEDRNFVFVSNVKKALLGGSVEQFGKEEIFVSIIRNVWASLKSKVPYQARKRFEESFKLKKAELLKKPDKLKWIVPFMKEIRINRLEQEINKNCDAFIRDLVTEINEMYRNAIAYYSELSRKYSIVGFQMNRGDYDTSAKLHFDAMHTVEDQVAADLKLLRKRMRFMNDILSDKKVESTLRDTIISFKILIKDTNKIREDLKAELERFMEAVKQQLEEHLSEIEASLNSLEIDDLYTFQM